MLKSEGDRLTRVIVCSPGKEYFGVDDLKAHNFAEKPDPEKAKRQHTRLKSILEGFGAEVIDIEELDAHPNSVFTCDACLSTPQGYIKLRMGLPSRRGEEGWIAKALRNLDEPRAGSIRAPGTVEGGDIILADSVAFIGCSERTNIAGIRQLASILQNMDYEIRIVSIPLPYFHLGGLMSLISPQTILCLKDFFEEDFLKGFDRVEIDHKKFISGNVICLGKGELIAEASNRVAIKALNEAGFKVYSLSLSEFGKGRGGPSCLIMPLERKGD